MSIFKFKHFNIIQSRSAMKVGTDALVLGSLITSEGKNRCLDVGAGTGVISLILAQRYRLLSIDAVEIDKPSFVECSENFKNSPWSDRLKCISSDFLEVKKDVLYDLVVSNPPFYSSTLKNEDLRRASARHVDSLPIGLFMKKVDEVLDVEGEFWLIIPSADLDIWLIQAAKEGLFPFTKIDVYGKPKVLKRTVIGLKRKQCELIQQSFTIRTEKGTYSDQYKDATKELHFNSLD